MDLISRQAAIDALDCINGVEEVLRSLPSVQPERTEERMETHACDLISRQDAIDALDVLCQEHRYKIPGKRETYSQYNEAWQDALDRAEGAIFNLPSAQPVVTDTNVGDTISRQAALEKVRAMQTYKLFVGDDMILVDKAEVQTELMMLPSAQPETNCSEIPNNSDIISRQQVIDAIEKMNIPEDMCVFEILSHIEVEIATLPSAQCESES